jgi:hypothetical protein
MSDNVTIEHALKQIEVNCYDKSKGQKSKTPNASKIKDYLVALKDCMTPSDWEQIVEVYSGIVHPKNRRKTTGRGAARGKVGRPRGKYYGMKQAERQEAMRAEAKALGVWHILYPTGCKHCKSKEYKHASGGVCNRCYTRLKALRKGVRDGITGTD